LHQHQKAIEITNLIIPTLNDSPEMIKKLCDWCVAELDPEVPVHFSAYHPDYMLDLPPTPDGTLIEAKRIAREAGLVNVYVGNARIPNGENTICSNCKATVIERQGFSITRLRLDENNNCISCGNHVKIVGEAKTSSVRLF
jgi:pyruvate formate lyase activating enzyme